MPRKIGELMAEWHGDPAVAFFLNQKIDELKERAKELDEEYEQ